MSDEDANPDFEISNSKNKITGKIRNKKMKSSKAKKSSQKPEPIRNEKPETPNLKLFISESTAQDMSLHNFALLIIAMSVEERRRQMLWRTRVRRNS